MKVLFVGIHNKPGMKPLDSRTVSGKTIDGIIENLPGFSCQKVNLFDADYMPKGNELLKLKMDFFERVEIDNDDVIVLLGADVQKQLAQLVAGNIVVTAAHPSLLYSKIGRPEYIQNTALAVREAWAKNKIQQTAVEK